VRRDDRPRSRTCPITPHGLPVRLLAEAPRRRRMPLAARLALLAAIAAVPILRPADVRAFRLLRRQPAAATAPGRAAPAAPADAEVNRVHQIGIEARPQDLPLRAAGFALGEGFGSGDEAKPAYDHTHVEIWVSAFTGAGVLAHSAPRFNPDSDEPMTPERGRHFRTLAAFLTRAESVGPLSPAPDPTTSVPGLRALALAGERSFAVWIHAPSRGYGEPVARARVTVRGVRPGRWRVVWTDDVTGQELAREERELRGQRAVLEVPSFTRHVVAFAERLGEVRRLAEVAPAPTVIHAVTAGP
jgi:hypothetical protein